jgi:hypothetical protein
MNRACWIVLGALAGCGGGGETVHPDGGTPDAGSCTAASAEGIAVTEVDAYGGIPYSLGYPPYAIDGCRLVYVARPEAGTMDGELRLRDLGSGTETVLAPAAERPRRPALAGDVVAWEATEGGKTVVRVSAMGAVKTLSGPFDHAGEPRVAEGAVVFTAWLAADDHGDTDVYLYQPATDAVTAVATGPAQQRWADVSATHVAWTDFVEDPDGAFGDASTDAADIVVLDRATGIATPRKMAGKQAFPLLGAEGKIGYLDWGLVHPEPKFSEYDLRLGDLGAAVDADVTVDHIVTLSPYVRPAARGTLIEWVSSPSAGGPTSLFRRGVDLASPAETVSGFEGMSVFGPSAAETITLVGASGPAGVTLRAFAR